MKYDHWRQLAKLEFGSVPCNDYDYDIVSDCCECVDHQWLLTMNQCSVSWPPVFTCFINIILTEPRQCYYGWYYCGLTSHHSLFTAFFVFQTLSPDSMKNSLFLACLIVGHLTSYLCNNFINTDQIHDKRVQGFNQVDLLNQSFHSNQSFESYRQLP